MEGGDDGKLSPIEEQEAFKAQVPPNWEAAEKHAKANSVCRVVNTKLDLDDKDSYCLCC